MKTFQVSKGISVTVQLKGGNRGTALPVPDGRSRGSSDAGPWVEKAP